MLEDKLDIIERKLVSIIDSMKDLIISLGGSVDDFDVVEAERKLLERRKLASEKPLSEIEISLNDCLEGIIRLMKN